MTLKPVFAVVGLGALCLALGLLAALAGLGQLADGLQPIGDALHLWRHWRDPEVGRWLSRGGLGASLLFIALGAELIRRLSPSLHGDARFARPDEIRRAGLRAKEGLILGEAKGRLLSFGGAEHVLLYAPTRTGKGVGVVIPNLLSWPRSLVVLDIKRENWAASAGWRARCGQSTFLFDPLDPEGATARFNPLSHIDRTDPIATVDDLQKIATLLFPTPDRADPFWAEAARTAFIGVAGYVAQTAHLPLTLGEVFRQLTDGDPRGRLMAAIADRRLVDAPLTRACENALTDFCAASENTFQSVRQTLTSRMGLWVNPRVDWATSASDFDLADLACGHTSLYLAVSPDNLARVAPLYSLLLQQVVDQAARRLPRPGAAPHLLIVLDEFARLGPAPAIAEGFAYLAGYGVRLLAVLQSPAQLRAQYGQDLAEDIVANCGCEVVFAPKDVKVAQALSERLGYRGQTARSTSRPAGLSAGRRSISLSEQRRALLLPQELLGMADDALLVLRAGTPPVRGRKLRYYKEAVFQRRVLAPPPLSPATDAPKAAPPPSDLTEHVARWAEAQAGAARLSAELGLEPPAGAKGAR